MENLIVTINVGCNVGWSKSFASKRLLMAVGRSYPNFTLWIA
ncbi:hypothetical protein SynROS8604_02295 [Synechococcus sp. ROS8604]|nr:hypothetical protein SynROS8604_02295 [Synechococcus sp. ROS8604]